MNQRDAYLKQLWAADDWERHQDGKLYHISTGQPCGAQIELPERVLPPLPDGTRPGADEDIPLIPGATT